ncbi:MAG: phage tail protein [Formivibrio sp.]|nr:phage tail protein [Formivibrio sp.]
MGGGGSSVQTTAPTPLTGVSIQTSANGLPIALVYGTTRVTPNLMGYWDFTAIPQTSSQTSGSKGGGGGSPSVSGYTYTASFQFALCEGPITGITNAWIDKTQENPSALFSLFLGTYPQAAWSYLTSNHPGEDLGYPGIAYAAAAGYDLGTSANLPNHNFEVQGKFLLGGGVLDADPKDIITDLLTNPATGVPNAPALGDLTQYSKYCKASGLLLSPCYDTQTAAASMLTDLFQLTNTGVYFSEGVLKAVPYGDETISNGVTYTPVLTPIGNLGDDDFLSDGSSDPITVKRNAIATTVNTSADACNQVTLEFLNRANAYIAETVTVQDQVSIDTYGLRPMSTITAHQIADANVAQAAAMLILQRSIAIRATYEFRLGWQWCYLEPTDLITITDTVLGLNLYPVRILSIEEDEYGTLTISAEDAPAGVASHVVGNVPQNGGYSADYNAAAGSVSAVCIFEPPFALASGTGLEVWAGVSGPVDSGIWGGANVWVSYDGTTYQLLTTINGPARVGHLAGMISPTSTGPLAVQLDGQGGQLLAASAADAAALHSLFYVGGASPEFMAYQGATLTGANAYNLSSLVRGAYGSAEAAHYADDPFVRVDDSLAKSGSLALSLIGSTIHFKFQSFNIWGGGLEDLSTLTAYTYTVSGEQATGNAVSGLTATAVSGSSVLTTLTWDADPSADHYVVDQSGDGVTWQRTGETKATTWADSALYGVSTRFRVASVRALASSWSSSAFLNIGYTGMWNSNGSTLMWNANSATHMWSS